MDNSIEKIMRDAFPPELPYGFAERVARMAMSQEETSTVWDFLLRLSPRAGLALGAVAALLMVLGFSGEGPGIVESVQNYDTYSNFIALP